MTKDFSNDARIDTLLTSLDDLNHPVLSFDPLNRLGAGVEITFNFPISGTKHSNTSEFQAMTGAQRESVRDTLAMIATYADITFREIAASDTPHIEFAVDELGSNVQGLASSLYVFNNFSDYGHIRDVTVTIDDDLAARSSLGPGSRFFFVVAHEVGHALGLEHPFEGIVVDGVNETTLTTVMAYGDGFRDTINEPSTLMVNDILALQYLYGANTETFAGDTVHRLSHEDIHADDGIGVLWDASGNDTVDFSDFTQSASGASDPSYSIKLAAGSRLIQEQGESRIAEHLFLAEGSSIENVLGTRFDDRITGTGVTNSLEGGNGSDIIYGGGGNDEIHGNSFGSPTVERVAGTVFGTDGWLFQFANLDGELLGGSNQNIGQPLNDFLGIRASAARLGTDPDDSAEDTLYGQAGNDTLDGGAGRDRLEGGTGNDTLTGGTSADMFVFKSNFGSDTITDFNASEDRLLLDDALWSGTLNAAQIVDQFGTAYADRFEFSFNGAEIDLAGAFSDAQIASTIEII